MLGIRSVDVNEHVVDISVDGGYVVIRTVKGRLFAFYRPSFMSLYVMSYMPIGVTLIVSAMLIFGGLNLVDESLCSKYAYICFILYFVAFVALVSGIVLMFIREKSLLIETRGGLRIRFRKPRISEKQLAEIIKKLSEEPIVSEDKQRI